MADKNKESKNKDKPDKKKKNTTTKSGINNNGKNEEKSIEATKKPTHSIEGKDHNKDSDLKKGTGKQNVVAAKESDKDKHENTKTVLKSNGENQENRIAKAPTKPPYMVHRSKDGLKLITSFRNDSVCSDEIVLAKTEDKSNRIESVCCSEDGQYVAWCDNNYIECIKFDNQERVFYQPNTFKSNCLMISPRSTRIVSFSTMSGGDNLHFWDLETQTILASMRYKKASQWKPVFSMNEDICLQHIGNELVLYANGKFDKPKQRIGHIKVDDFSLSSSSFHDNTYQHLYSKRTKNKTHYIAIYTAGTKGQPSIVKIYKYPNMNDCITNKSFFKADRVKFSWSPSGNSLLLTCQTDFDPSSKSYYGEQSLNFMSVKGDSYFVKLPKEGTISHIEWYPCCDKDMFVCVYGLMPAKVSLFNNKCEVIYNFGDQGSFNETAFSPFGSLLAVFGFGNLAGQLCIWDFDKKKLIANVKVPETTGLEWCADGKHILTCTTTPRLRVGNGYRIWHYTGSLLHETINNDPVNNIELYDFVWQPRPNCYKKPKCDAKAPQMPNLLTQSKLSKFQTSAGKYVPPSMRNSGSSGPSFIDSAIGVSAGGRHIVGLESLNKSKDLRAQAFKGRKNSRNKSSKSDQQAQAKPKQSSTTSN